MRVYRDIEENGTIVAKPIFDIIECTYSGKDMGERSITATFDFPSPVEFKIGDYVELQMHELLRDGTLAGSIEHIERFYIYTMPTIKKTARANTHGKGFEHIVTFYPAQYELSLVQMRNLGDGTSDNLIYTGFDSFSFVGGAKALMKRIMRVLDEAYGKDTWKYFIANEVDEESNDAIEMVTFSFSGNSVMDALIKLNGKEGINTTFFINNRTIYVGYKRAYFCRTIDNATIDPDISTQTFNFQYGKTSHENVAINYGGLYEITKSVGKETPITKLFAYGASRNLNRYYCSDRIGTGRYVNRLMLPSFQNDGETDFILSQEVDTYGIREGSKTFEEIYPSLRYVTYGDIRQVKYCIKIKASGITGDNIEDSAYPIARVQCYRVIESATKGVNTLVKAAPPDDLAIYVRALDKVVKVVLCGGATDQEAISKQIAKDGTWGNGNGRVPATTYQGSEYIPGSCFLVHDMGFSDTHLEHKTTDRSVWFTNPNDESAMGVFSEEIQTEIKLHQINYTDDFWLTDLYVFTAYNQTYFNRLGYSAYSYPVLNSNYTSAGGDVAHDSVLVNEVIEVEPVVIDDTSAGIGDVEKLQHTFDVYLRDIGFKIDEQSDFGKMVFVLNGALKVSFLDGNLVGREFECKFQNDAQSYCVCAYNEDGTINNAFFEGLDYSDKSVPLRAFDNGAIWRLRLERINLDEPDYSNLNLIMPNTIVNANSGDHVVLLDLFMPDIYVHAAQNRLLREARHYLAANDRGKIQYAVAFDKVRMQQIPAYALQMREGLKIRMVDSDLEISTKNRVKKLFEGSLLTRTSLYETTYDSQPTEGYYYTLAHRDYYYLKDKGVVQFMGGDLSEYLKSGDSVFYIKQQSDLSYRGTCYIPKISHEDIDNNGELFVKNGKVIMRCFEKVTTANGTFYKETNEYRTFSVSNIRSTTNGNYVGDVYISKFGGSIFKTSDYNSKTGEYEIHGVVEYDVRFTHKYDYTIYTPNTYLKPQGDEVYAPSKVLLEFSQNKHYDITIVAKNTNLLRTDEIGNPKLVLLNNLSDDAKMYAPADIALTYEYIGNNSIRFTFSFDLDSSFNDTQDYYPALIYVSDNSTEYVETVIESVIESDVAGNADLDYAEFTIQDVTIKITDSSNRTFAQPIKEISATLSEQNNASAWGTLMNRIEKTEIEGGENNKISQTIINSARRHYQQLLNLRDSIFDPDGTCNDVFLQIMMLQVGADSMNYYLDNTRQDVDGTPHNYSVAEEDGQFHFRVYNEDRLHHIVYTEHGGTWKHIGGSVDFTLNPNEDGTYPTYFVAIKCKRYGDEGEWVCEPIQHKVNEEEEYYYFNWGILSADEAGVYTLVETRGNAYMYGDNLICGKISSLARNSYFDLTHGDFVLGNGTGSSLEYINGILTIRGSKGDTDDILNRLGIAEKSVEQSAYVNVYIYGDVVFKYVEGNTVFGKKLCVVSKSSILTSCIEDNGFAGMGNDPFNSSCLVVFKEGKGVKEDYFLYNVNKDILGVYNWGEKFEVSENADVYVFSAQKEYIEYSISNSFTEVSTFPSGGSGVWTIKDIMIGMDSNSAIKNAVAAEEDARTEALAGVISDIAELQKQIDGEVSSYFYPNAPIVSEEDESIRTDIEPMVEWLKNYTLENGVYILNPNARNELINNLGDTFTNTETYVDNTTTPLAGKSWRWCDATSNPSVTKYITVQYDEDGVPVEKKLHWHIITDTDALRALEAAANAQATADGKCTTFLEKPTEGYNVGDLWILEDDNIHPEGKKGDILTANFKRATYNESDWSKKVKYTDDTALENMVIGGRNLLRDSKVMGISQWALPTGSATYTKNADYSTITMNAEMAMNCVNTCTLQTIDKSWKDKNIVSSVMVRTSQDDNIKCGIVLREGSSGYVAQSYYDATYMPTKAGEWTKVYTTFKCNVDAEDVTIYFVTASNKGSIIGDTFDFKDWKIEYGTKPTDWAPAPEDVSSAIAIAESKAEALDYLKAALTDGSTEIAGGIAMTNVLMLKSIPEGDNQAVVTAGMSGLTEHENKRDNVLLWGGGTYQDAFAAANNDYKMGDGSEITTLLKKDGTGKIGIFKISETQAVVDVPNQGRIIIDASKGNIGIYDSDGNEKVEITSSDIDKDTADVKTFSNPKEYSSYTSVTTAGDTNTGSLVLQSLTLKDGQRYILEQDESLTHMFISYLIRYNNNTLSNVHISFKVAIKSNSLQKHLLCSVDYNISDGVLPTYREGTLKMSITKIASGVRDPRLYDNVEIGIYDAMVTGDVAGYGTNLPLAFSIKKVWFGSANAVSNDATPVESQLYNIRVRTVMEEKTIIGNNGLQVQNDSGFVQILNDDSEGAYVRITGLPEWSESLERGRLCYRDGNDGYRHLVIKVNEPS